MKRFIIDDSFFDILPDVNIGILILKNVDENKSLSDKDLNDIKNLLDDSNKIAEKYITSDVISENEVVKKWRETYQKFPTKKGARCSIESLLKRIIHNNPVSTIFPAVDITNSISLKYAFPIGAEDFDKIEGDLHLGVVKGGEEFFPIGDDKEDPALPGEITYYDDKGIVCRCFNWRDGKRTAIDDNSTNEFIAMECVEEGRVKDLEIALDELAALMTKYLNAEVVVKEIMNKNNREIL